jgi:hypothetical protein
MRYLISNYTWIDQSVYIIFQILDLADHSTTIYQFKLHFKEQ